MTSTKPARPLLLFIALLGFCLAGAQAAPQAPRSTFAIGENDFLLDGKPFLIRCGEMHFARIPREYWAHRLRMARAMGLNTVCAYLFWNFHESAPGKFDFSGNKDVAEFCRLAQAEGLKVILRPGPYSCAEWDFGGFPYWLLKNPDIKLRTRDPIYLQACQRYIRAVRGQLANLQVTRGGPIIMVQVENEYGSYGKDKEYIGILRDYLKEAFEVPLFTCDGPSQLKNDTRDDLFCVVNFGSNPENNFKPLRAIRPKGPLMCGEYYPGWFDSWGKPHHTGASDRIVKELDWMLEHNASFSIYMVHGGTSFGFTAGANCPPFSPQSTSYDYDAPISEAGWDTPKIFALRELFLKHLAPGETLPEVPARQKVIGIDKLELAEFSPLAANLPKPVKSDRPKHMELYDQGQGCILYRTQLPAGSPAALRITELHDYGLIFLNGNKVATLDRRRNQNSVQLPARSEAMTLDLLIDTFGHVNYGGYLHDRKGITEKVELVTAQETRELTGWQVFNLPLESRSLEKVKFSRGATEKPAFYRVQFDLAHTGDTFLDFSTWGKGVAWINGHNLGRYWNIGPQQALYCPGPWLRVGQNELIVLELNGTAKHTVAGLTKPILNQVNEQAATAKHRKPGENMNLIGLPPLKTGSFADGKDWQTVQFAPTGGRYFCLEALNSYPNDAFTTCAELYLLGADGKDLPRDAWKVAYADSEELEGDDGRADNVFDLQSTTIWHTEWESTQPRHPHQIVLDLGSEQTVTGLRYLPRQDSPNGRIKDFRLYVSKAPFSLKAAAESAIPQDDGTCNQPSPEAMAGELGITLPHRPWHVANIWWEFEKGTEHFQSLEIDVTIDRDVPSTYNLYVSPCGIAKISNKDFYGGLQSNVNGWANATNQTRVHPGKGAIFSRWSSDKKTPVSLENVRVAGPDCLVESAGYEGEFCSVRRPYDWTKGTYTYQITRGETEVADGKTNTWFNCRVKDSQGKNFEVGSLRFEGDDFTFWNRHSAFVEVYSTEKIPRSGIPRVNITFGWPRINGQPPALKRAHAYYPSKTGPASPDCAWIKAAGDKVRVEVGPIFQRDEAQRRHDLAIRRPGT